MAEYKGRRLARINTSDYMVRDSDIPFIMGFDVTRRTGEIALLPGIVEDAISTPDVQCVLPSKVTLFSFNSNPVLCGTIAFNLKVLFEDAVVRFANHHLSPILVIHLYNALQQKVLLRQQWPAMEELIKTQIDNLFFGALSKDAVDIHKYLSLRLRKPLSEFAPNTHMKNKELVITDAHTAPRVNKLSPRCLSPTKTSALFAGYCGGQANILKSLYSVDGLMRKSRTAKKHRKSRKITELNILKFIPQFQDWLHDALPTISINYVDLTRQCNALLKTIIDLSKINVPVFRSWIPAA